MSPNLWGLGEPLAEEGMSKRRPNRGGRGDGGVGGEGKGKDHQVEAKPWNSKGGGLKAKRKSGPFCPPKILSTWHPADAQ